MPGFIRPGLVVDLLRESESRPCIGPTRIKGDVRQDFCHLGPSDPVDARKLKVMPECAIGYPLANQSADRDDATRLKGQLSLAAPHLAEEDIVVEAGELGRKIAQLVMTCRLLHCHCLFLQYGKLLLLAVHVGHKCSELCQSLLCVFEHGLTAVKSGDLCHFLVRQSEVEELDVLCDVGGSLGSGDHDVSLLDVPAQDDLGRGLAVLLCQILDQRFAHDGIISAPTQGEPGLQRDVVLLEECFEFRLREVGVAFALDESGRDLALVKDLLGLVDVKVGQTNGVKLASFVCGLELAVTGKVVSCGLVQDHEVDVVDAQALQGFINLGLSFEERGPQFRFEEDLVTALA